MNFQPSFKRMAFIAVSLILSPNVFAQKSTPQSAVKITSVEGITEYQLANGLRVLLFPDPSKSTITVNVTYLVGSHNEGYGETGMAHLLEHMMFKGSAKHPNVTQEFTAHGGWSNGTTWYDRTNYYETITATEENFEWALDFESDRMVNSFIAKKDLESEFSVVRNEFENDENDPSSILAQRVASTAYLWHNYGKDPIGSKEDIERVPVERLKAFYKKYYQPDNAVLTIAGKIDEAKTLALVSKYFGAIPRPERVIEEPYTVEPVQDGERYVELRRAGDVQEAMCGYHIPSGSHPDFAAVDALVDILTTEPAGRLYTALVDTKKASSVYGYTYAQKDPGYVYFGTEVLKEKSLDDAKLTMLNLLDSLSAHPVTTEELERAKNNLLKDFDQTYNNSEEVGLELSEYMAMGDWRLWFIYRDNIEKLTVDDVNRVVKAYFKPSNRTVGVFIPDNNADRAEIPPSPDVNALVKDYKGKEALGNAEEFTPSPANIDTRTKTGTLPGGAKYALLNKTTRGGAVNAMIQLHIGNETALQNKAELVDFTATMLERGTKTKTYKQMQDALSKLKADFYLYGDGQDVIMMVQTVDKNLVAVLKLITDMLRNPTFPESEFEKVKEEELSYIEQEKSDPWSLSFTEYSRIATPYPKSDFRYEMTADEEAEALKNVKPDDIKKFYADFFNGANADVVLVGSFDVAAVLAELKPMLQNWTSPVQYERAKSIYFDVKPEIKVVAAKDKKSAVMAAGYNLQLQDNDPDYPALLIGNFMLGGGAWNSRLQERLREKEGYCYSAGSYIEADAFDKVGVFGCYASYNPRNNDSLLVACKEELNRAVKDGFTEQELKDAVAGYLQVTNVMRSKDQNLAYTMCENLSRGRTMKWDGDREKKISALTVSEVNAALKKWIEPEKIIYVQVGEFEAKKK